MDFRRISMTIFMSKSAYNNIWKDQQMGNLCQAHTDDPTVYNSGDRPISSTMRIAFIYSDDS